MSGIVLATASEDFEGHVRDAFGGVLNGDLRCWRDGLLRGDPTRAIAEIARSGPEVVAVGPGLPVDTALELTRTFDRERPEISVVIVAEPTPGLWEQALRAGARDVVAPDAPGPELRSVLERALETAHRRRSNLVPSGEGPAGGSGTRLISVVSPKGGSGKTTISSNLAVGLARLAPGGVVLVDFDLQFGDVANALRLTPELTLADTARASLALDATVLKAYLVPHPVGLYALCAPESPAEADDISVEHAARVLELLRGEFPYVVVDTAAGIDEITLVAMEQATDLVLVGATDVASTRSMRKEVEALDVIGLTTQRRHFVLNRADARVGLGPNDIEATIGMKVDVAVPSSRAVPLSMNQGTPLLESDGRSTAGRAMGELVNRFASAPAPTSGGILRRWREDR